MKSNYSLNLTCKRHALQNLQEEHLSMDWCGNLDSSMVKNARLVIWRSVVQIPVQVQMFLLKIVFSRRISICQSVAEVQFTDVAPLGVLSHRLRLHLLLKVPERYEKCLRVSFPAQGKSLSTLPSGRQQATRQTANVGGNRVNPSIRILPLPSTNGLLCGRMSGQRSGQVYW